MAVLMTRCHVSTLGNRTIVGSQRTMTAAETAKNHAPLTMSDTASAKRSNPLRPRREEGDSLIRGASHGVHRLRILR